MENVYRIYPVRSVALYNVVTLLHFGLGAAGILIAYGRWPALGWMLALLYLAIARGQMYVMMPLVVCPSCVYRTMSRARCVSALNIVSAGMRRSGPPADFARRAEGALCHNNLYLGSLIAPVPLILIGLMINFSPATLATALASRVCWPFATSSSFARRPVRIALPRAAARTRRPWG